MKNKVTYERNIGTFECLVDYIGIFDADRNAKQFHALGLQLESSGLGWISGESTDAVWLIRLGEGLDDTSALRTRCSNYDYKWCGELLQNCHDGKQKLGIGAE